MSLETLLSLKDQSILCMPFSNTGHMDAAFLQESDYCLNTDLLMSIHPHHHSLILLCSIDLA